MQETLRSNSSSGENLEPSKISGTKSRVNHPGFGCHQTSVLEIMEATATTFICSLKSLTLQSLTDEVKFCFLIYYSPKQKYLQEKQTEAASAI